MKNEKKLFYCTYCLMDGRVRPATHSIFNFVDGLHMGMCLNCFEIEVNTPMEIYVDPN